MAERPQALCRQSQKLLRQADLHYRFCRSDALGFPLIPGVAHLHAPDKIAVELLGHHPSFA